MNRISIRNSFIHVLVTCYFKHAYNIYCTNMGKELTRLQYGDLANQRNVFDNILRKLQGTKYGEPSFLNEIFILLKVKYSYPVVIDLTPDESFWFEYVINLNPRKIKENFESFANERGISRLFGTMTDTFTPDILSKFNTPEAVEYLRSKFVSSERIGNSPAQQGWAISPRSGNAYRV